MEIKYFSMSELFHDPISGKDYPEHKRIKGKIPYISATVNNNEISDFIDTDSIMKAPFTPMG